MEILQFLPINSIHLIVYSPSAINFPQYLL